jgi:molybdopterin-biosynthesis enzyme MoeA-like protein
MVHEPMVEIFSIGTELVMGRIHDTNSFWMAQELVALGAHMRRITVLLDDVDVLREAFEQAIPDTPPSCLPRVAWGLPQMM